MMAQPWPDWLDSVWAKSPERGGRGEAESLAQHTWNVLEKLAQTIRLRPWLPNDLGFPRLWHVLFWACWLHDWGKAAQGFQDRLRGGSPWSHRHELLSLAFLDWIGDAFSDEERVWVAAAIASHHQDITEIRQTYAVLWHTSENILAQRLDEIPDDSATGLWHWLNTCAESWVEALGLQDAGIQIPTLPSQADALAVLRNAGADRARFWLKAYAKFADDLKWTAEPTLTIGTLVLRGHVITADHAASAHAGELPKPELSNPVALLARLGMDPATLYGHQAQSAATQGSAVLVAPTGSGKTEAAILWACAQRRNGGQMPRLFYTLPYQASMNAMYDRLNRAAFTDQVGLEHSRSVLALYRRLLDSQDQPASVRLAKWHRNLARLHHFPVRVLSPYQILKAPYQLKGYEALLTDCAGAAFVLDEIHAYEPERLARILATAKYLRQSFGARFFVMSATLPRLLRTRLADALGEHATIEAPPDFYSSFRRHRLAVLDGDLLSDQPLNLICRQARRGHSVLVACNTVRRAQDAYGEIKSRLGIGTEVILLHSRFNGQDRLLKEKTVQDATGSKSIERRPVVLVATQVVEVSLDIDLDTIYTDPAPLEALLQRFGRINRRQRRRWSPVYVLTEPSDGQRVYQENLVKAGLAILKRESGRLIDEAGTSTWLDEVYQGEIAAHWSRQYDPAYRDFERACIESLRAFNSSEELEKEFYRAFDSVEVLPVCLEPEYRRLMNSDEPLEASQLLVPIQWGRYEQLRRTGKATEAVSNALRIVDCPYDSEYGLRFL